MVHDLLVRGVEVLLLSGTASGAVLMVGGVVYQFRAWDRSLPPGAQSPALSLPVQFAYDEEALHLVQQEADPEQEADERSAWERSILEFAFVGSRYGFSWRNLRRYCPNNDDWKRGIEVLTTSEPPVLQPARGNISPRWESGWYYSLLRLAVRWGNPPLSLPYLPGERRLFVNWQRPVRSRTNANERTEWNERTERTLNR